MTNKIKLEKYQTESINPNDVSKTLKTEIDEKQLVVLALNNIGQQTNGQFKIDPTDLIDLYDVLKTKGPEYGFEKASFANLKKIVGSYNFGTGEALNRAKQKMLSKIGEAEKEKPKEESK